MPEKKKTTPTMNYKCLCLSSMKHDTNGPITRVVKVAATFEVTQC